MPQVAELSVAEFRALGAVFVFEVDDDYAGLFCKEPTAEKAGASFIGARRGSL